MAYIPFASRDPATRVLQLDNGILPAGWHTTYPFNSADQPGPSNNYVPDLGYEAVPGKEDQAWKRSAVTSVAGPPAYLALTASKVSAPARTSSGTVTQPRTSGMVSAHGVGAILHGLIEADVAFPYGDGLWFGFWLCAADPMKMGPTELDIEGFPMDGGLSVRCTAILPTAPGASTSTTNQTIHPCPAGRHVFTYDKQATYIAWLIDGVEVKRVSIRPDQDIPMFPIVALAIVSATGTDAKWIRDAVAASGYTPPAWTTAAVQLYSLGAWATP